MWDRTLIEDKRATDIQQIGYNSGRVPAGRLLLDSESPLQSFHAHRGDRAVVLTRHSKDSRWPLSRLTEHVPGLRELRVTSPTRSTSETTGRSCS